MKTYMGTKIHRCGTNGSGMRWYSLTDSGRVLAGTLADIKRMIKERKA